MKCAKMSHIKDMRGCRGGVKQMGININPAYTDSKNIMIEIDFLEIPIKTV